MQEKNNNKNQNHKKQHTIFRVRFVYAYRIPVRGNIFVTTIPHPRLESTTKLAIVIFIVPDMFCH